uniref:Uncharacterized protein n=1 Tax=viral metagenome TaxID=1070528 RepID=A0A6C0CQQ2_9ZZZZ
MSLIEVIDCLQLEEKVSTFNKYLDESPTGEISSLEKAYFQILYDLHFSPTIESLDIYKELQMINITNVSIDYDLDTYEKYFKVSFRSGKTLEIGKNLFP